MFKQSSCNLLLDLILHFEARWKWDALWIARLQNRENPGVSLRFAGSLKVDDHKTTANFHVYWKLAGMHLLPPTWKCMKTSFVSLKMPVLQFLWRWRPRSQGWNSKDVSEGAMKRGNRSNTLEIEWGRRNDMASNIKQSFFKEMLFFVVGCMVLCSKAKVFRPKTCQPWTEVWKTIGQFLEVRLTMFGRRALSTYIESVVATTSASLRGCISPEEVHSHIVQGSPIIFFRIFLIGCQALPDIPLPHPWLGPWETWWFLTPIFDSKNRPRTSRDEPTPRGPVPPWAVALSEERSGPMKGKMSGEWEKTSQILTSIVNDSVRQEVIRNMFYFFVLPCYLGITVTGEWAHSLAPSLARHFHVELTNAERAPLRGFVSENIHVRIGKIGT